MKNSNKKKIFFKLPETNTKKFPILYLCSSLLNVTKHCIKYYTGEIHHFFLNINFSKLNLIIENSTNTIPKMTVQLIYEIYFNTL